MNKFASFIEYFEVEGTFFGVAMLHDGSWDLQ